MKNSIPESQKYLCLEIGVGGIAHIGNICVVKAPTSKDAREKARKLFRIVPESTIEVLPIDELKDEWIYFYI